MKKLFLGSSLLLIFVSWGKLDKENNDLTTVSKQIKNDLMSVYFSDIDSENYQKPKITENDSVINVYFEDIEKFGTLPTGLETEFYLKSILIGDLNNDEEKDYLVPYTLFTPPGNNYIDLYAIYLNELLYLV